MDQMKDLDAPNWAPLETMLRQTGRLVSLCASFMWMYRENGIEFYKHIDSRRYLLLDSQLRCWQHGTHGLELSDFDREFHLVTGTTTTADESVDQSRRGGRWAGDISAERIGNLWRPEDHEAVMHNLRAADRLATQVIAFASAKAVEQFRKTSQGRRTMESNPKLNIRGLRLPPATVKRLQDTGIFARPEVSLEYQNLAKRYVVRGVESGGAVAELGRYVSFAGENGEPLPWLQPIDSLAVNGVHAVIVAPVVTRIDMFRTGRTYELSITRHRPSDATNGNRPKLIAEEVFRGTNGYLGLELWGKDKALSGSVMPQFFARSGEEIAVPEAFAPATQALTAAVNCVRCTSSHYLRPAQAAAAAAGQGAGPDHSKSAETVGEDVPDHLDPTLAVSAK
jgi:hypothetical protein